MGLEATLRFPSCHAPDATLRVLPSDDVLPSLTPIALKSLQLQRYDILQFLFAGEQIESGTFAQNAMPDGTPIVEVESTKRDSITITLSFDSGLQHFTRQETVALHQTVES